MVVYYLQSAQCVSGDLELTHPVAGCILVGIPTGGARPDVRRWVIERSVRAERRRAIHPRHYEITGHLQEHGSQVCALGQGAQALA